LLHSNLLFSDNFSANNSVIRFSSQQSKNNNLATLLVGEKAPGKPDPFQPIAAAFHCSFRFARIG
jgi:hypothetical protein